ncbi:hypothetical protein KCU81_g3604, partial [Aureobasidium melanogenum]
MLISSAIISTNSTRQIISSTVSSSAVDDLPTIAASLTFAPEFTAITTSCNDLVCVTVAVDASTTSTFGALTTDPAITTTTATTSAPEFTATTVSCEDLDDLLCVSLAIGSSTTSTIGDMFVIGSDPTASIAQPTITETSATETSLPTTTTSTSSACTPLPTSCDDYTYFRLKASSSDSAINGKYAQVSAEGISMTEENMYYAMVFCLTNDNDLLYPISDYSQIIGKTSSNRPIQIGSMGTPLNCTAVSNEDCTATLQCTWQDDYKMVVDSADTLYLTDEKATDYSADGDPRPVNLILSW